MGLGKEAIAAIGTLHYILSQEHRLKSCALSRALKANWKEKVTPRFPE